MIWLRGHSFLCPSAFQLFNSFRLFKSQTLVETTMPHGNADSRVSSLTEQEIEHARVVFHKIDANHNNSIDMFELKAAFEHFGQKLSDHQLSELIAYLDKDSSLTLDFHEFVKLIELQRRSSVADTNESNIAGAYIALGGVPTDKKSFIMASRLKSLIKDEFKLTFDIDDLLAQVGITDIEKGKLDYEKFVKMIAMQPRQPVAKVDNNDPFARLGLA